MSSSPPSRSTMVQEKMRTSPLVQNGRMISRNSTAAQRARRSACFSASAAGSPISGAKARW